MEREIKFNRFSGDKNPKAKINHATVLSIRRLRSKGVSLRDIAERHSISIAQVSAIAKNKEKLEELEKALQDGK